MNTPPTSPAVPSPCINVCQLDERGAWCVGCGRTTAEIAAWPVMTNAGKTRVLAEIYMRDRRRQDEADASRNRPPLDLETSDPGRDVPPEAFQPGHFTNVKKPGHGHRADVVAPVSGALLESRPDAAGTAAATSTACHRSHRFVKYTGQASAQDKTKKCEACGALFTCGTGDCWCALVPLSAAVLRELKEKYQDCLCPACLSSWSGATSANFSQPEATKNRSS